MRLTRSWKVLIIAGLMWALAAPTVALAGGVTLTVTDSGGLSDTDTITMGFVDRCEHA